MNRSQVARAIDHTVLKADATTDQIRALCDEARRFGVAAVCVNGNRVAQAVEALKGSDVAVAVVVGFPLGAAATESKAMEAALACAEGATEVDMVIDVAGVKENDAERVRADIAAVVEASGAAAVKVILETCLLTDDEKRRAAQWAVDAGAAFVKTSTGFSTGGATVDDVRLLREVVGDRAKVKASGGIRDATTALAMLEAGADRLGLSSTAAVLSGVPE